MSLHEMEKEKSPASSQKGDVLPLEEKPAEGSFKDYLVWGVVLCGRQ